MEPIRRDHIAGKLLRAVERIVDRSRDLGEVSVTHLHRRYREELTAQPALFESLEVRHEEEPVLPVVDLRQPNGAAQCESVLVPFERILRPLTCERVLFRIEFVVAEELEHRPMELVRSRLGRNIDLRGGAPELGRKDSGLDLELLQRVDRWQENISVEVDVRILHAIQGEVVELASLASDRNILLSARPALTLIGDGGIRESIAHVGTERDKLEEVAAIQRHVDDTLILDDGPHRRVLRRDQRGRAGDLDGLVQLSDLQNEVEARRLLDLQLHVILRDRAETRQLHLDVVLARLQAGQVVYAGFVADHGARGVCGRVGHGNGHAGNDGAARVANHAADAGLCLSNRG